MLNPNEYEGLEFRGWGLVTIGLGIPRRKLMLHPNLRASNVKGVGCSDKGLGFVDGTLNSLKTTIRRNLAATPFTYSSMGSTWKCMGRRLLRRRSGVKGKP